MVPHSIADKSGSGTHTFTASAEQLVATIQNPHGKGGRRTITLTAAVNALTGLRLTWAAKIDGAHVSRAADADFNTATDRWAATTNLYQLSAASGQIDFDFSGVGELKIYATALAGTTVAVEFAV